MAGNKLITLEEFVQDMVCAFIEALNELPTEMFIEGQYNWERPEFDEHG